MKIKIRKKLGFEDLELPRYMTEGAAGMDLRAAIEGEMTLQPGEIQLIPAGIYIALPLGFEAQIRPRSGMALRQGMSIVNSPGTVDADYRGEIGVIAINLGTEPIEIRRGMRVAQMVIQKVERADWLEVEQLETTSRAAGGFGHSGD